MPALPTWWCGEAAAWRDVEQELDGKVVRSTFPRRGRTSQVHDPLDAAVEADPDAWTVQGRLRFSRAPIWGRAALTPGPAMVRVYAVADGGGRWHVLPGGMTRVARREDASVSMQRGGSSLDTWVLTDGPVDTFSMLPPRLQVDDIARRRPPVSSRTGENLFWLGRYTERTEQLVRLARSTLLLIGADNDADEPVQRALSALAVASGLAPRGVPTLLQSAHLFERAVLAGLADARGAVSVAYNLAALERASQALRERLSAEQWGVIRQMGETFAAALDSAPGELPGLSQVLPALDRLALQLAAVTGAQTDRMTRDAGWRLLTVGRLLERLIGLATRMQAVLDARALAGAAGIDLLLELFDSAITCRTHSRPRGLHRSPTCSSSTPRDPRAFTACTPLARGLGELRRRRSLRPLLARLPADERQACTLDALRGADDARMAATCVRCRAPGRCSGGAGRRCRSLLHARAGADQRLSSSRATCRRAGGSSRDALTLRGAVDAGAPTWRGLQPLDGPSRTVPRLRSQHGATRSSAPLRGRVRRHAMPGTHSRTAPDSARDRPHTHTHTFRSATAQDLAALGHARRRLRSVARAPLRHGIGSRSRRLGAPARGPPTTPQRILHFHT